jgi:dihydroorotate dehydrogenase electron transfer subunit
LMTQSVCPVISLREAGRNLFVLSFRHPEMASRVLPGQFVNIRVRDEVLPLLRRPFSVYRVEGEDIEVIFNIVGTGTRILSEKRPGSGVDVIGPLGSPYQIEGDYDTALLVGGGLGVAPLPMITRAAGKIARPVETFLGARSKDQLAVAHLVNLTTATDDGSSGFRGTVVDLLRDRLDRAPVRAAKIFACGPNPMLSALGALAESRGIPCEVSLESAMACGIGICQGCPVERSSSGKKYSLICKEGPVFDSRTLVIR